MALFTKKSAPVAKEKEVVTKANEKEAPSKNVVVAEVVKAPQVHRGIDATLVLLRPHITEKATDLSERNVYAFEISKHANKVHVRHAIEKFYKVKPLKIAVINEKSKYMKNPRTGRVQLKKQGMKKALVYLKKGDKIEFV